MVRTMRERLLVAHKQTENALTGDALTLRKVIEGAVVDIDELHVEVVRKKELSLHNEQVADEFRDRLSSKLRTIVQSVNEFKSEQDEEYNVLRTLVSDMKDARQKESASLTSDISRLNTTVVAVFKELHQRAQELQTARTARIARGRDDAKLHMQQLATAMERTQDDVVRRIGELRDQAMELGSSMDAWADKVSGVWPAC